MTIPHKLGLKVPPTLNLHVIPTFLFAGLSRISISFLKLPPKLLTSSLVRVVYAITSHEHNSHVLERSAESLSPQATCKELWKTLPQCLTNKLLFDSTRNRRRKETALRVAPLWIPSMIHHI